MSFNWAKQYWLIEGANGASSISRSNKGINMLSFEELKIFDKLRAILRKEDYGVRHYGLMCELYANGFQDGEDFQTTAQDWDDIITPNPQVTEIVERWRGREDN
jgi:hypothetical protein